MAAPWEEFGPWNEFSGSTKAEEESEFPSVLQMPQWEPSVRETFGEPSEPPPVATPTTGFLEELKDRTGDVFRGGLMWIPSLIKSASIIGSYLPGTGDPTSELLAGKSPLTPPPTLTPEEQPGFKVGAAIGRGIEELFPPPQDTELSRSVAEGLGQVGSMLVGGGVAKTLGAGVTGTTLAATALGGVQEFDDAFTRSRQRGDDPDTAFAKALGYATVAGLIENRLGAGRILRQMFPSAAEAAKKITALGVSKKIAGNFIAGGLEEGSQRFAQNWIVDEKPSFEGVVEEGLPGAIVEMVTGLPAAGVGTRERTPNAVQQEATGAVRDVRQQEVTQQGQVEVPAESGSQTTAEARVELPPLRPGDTRIKIEQPDGTVIDAVSNGQQWEIGEHKIPNVGRAVEGLWSDGPLRPGERIVEGGEISETQKSQEEVLTQPETRAVSHFPRQSETLGLGEPAVPPTVETVRQQRAEEQRTAIPTAPGEKTTESRGTYFAGKNPTETSAMMQERATAFQEGKTDEKIIVDLARAAAGDPAVQLDNQAANFAIKDLLVRLNARIRSTKNPVDQQRSWEQIDRLAELSRRLGAEDARSLVSRHLAYKQIDWLMPLLSWRGIVQDKWRKALGIAPNQSIEEAKAKLPKDELDKLKKRLPELDGETAKKLEELSNRAKSEPQGVRRNKTLDEMVKLIQQDAPISKMDLLRDVWYGSVLARVGTMLNVLAGSYSTGASFAGLAALDRLVRLHPIQAAKIVGQFIGGTIEGTVIADQIARKGAYHLLPDAEQRMVNLLSGKAGARFDNLEALLKKKNPVGLLAYTRRFMAALDYIGALGTRDAMVLYGALSRGDQESLDALDKKFDRDANKRAAQQAKDEMPNASLAERLVRKREILEEGVSDEVQQSAVEISRRAAQNADPRGIPGLIYKATAKLPFFARAPLGLAFMRSAMNMVQNAMDYTPGIGAVTALRGKLNELPKSHPLHRFGLDVPIEERRMMVAAQGASLGIAAIAAALFLGDDDKDDDMEISGSWLGLTPERKRQLMDAGERPNSIRFNKGGPWVNFKQMPFAPPLAMVGTMRDQQRFHGKDWDGASAMRKLTAGYFGGLLYIRDISSLSGIAGIFDKNSWSAQDPTKIAETANRFAANSVGRAASGYIPSFIKEIDQIGDRNLYRPNNEEMAGWWIRNIPYAQRTVGPGPALNNFGEPVQLTPPPIKSWVGFGKDDDLYSTLGGLASRGIFLPEPGPTAKIVDDSGDYRTMTEDEWYKFIKTRGPIFKAGFTPDTLEMLRTSTDDEAIKWLRDHNEKSNAEARIEMFPMTRYEFMKKLR